MLFYSWYPSFCKRSIKFELILLISLVLSLLIDGLAPFLMTSIQDAFPKTFVEAMFCGLPIVCFEKTSMAFYLKNKKNGYIAKYKSSKSLSEGINWISETNKIKLLKKNARNLAIKKFGPTNLTNKHINLYKKILKKKK